MRKKFHSERRLAPAPRSRRLQVHAGAGNRAGHRLAVVLAVMLLQLWGETLGAGQGGGSSEYAVKAAFLFHFAQFVEWPEVAFHDNKSPLVYCTVGFDPFKGALEAALNGKTIGARGFQVRHLKQVQESQGCHLLFIGQDLKRQTPAIAAQMKGQPVLVVGESERFVEDGGMIGFALEDNKVRFAVNLEAAEKAGLKISAKLLALAKTVIGGPKRG